MEPYLNSDDRVGRRNGRRIFSSLRRHADTDVPVEQGKSTEGSETDYMDDLYPPTNSGPETIVPPAHPNEASSQSHSATTSEQHDSEEVSELGDETPASPPEPVALHQTSETEPQESIEESPIAEEPADPTPIVLEIESLREVNHEEVFASSEAQPETETELPRVIAITNQKGGVGKTTTSVNLGASLAELGYRVLVIDLDPQGNASTGMGVNPRNVDHSIYEVILQDLPIEDAVEPTAVRNLFCVPATIDLAGAEIELVPAMMREMRLKQAIDAVKDEYDWVLIDCPPSLGLLTVNGLAAADDVVVPIQCEYYALEGLGQLLRNVSLIQTRINPNLKVRGIVLTMFDARTRLAEQVESDVREHFGDTVYQTVIPRTVRLSEAPSFGQPIVVFDPSSRGAVAYRNLAKEVSRGATIGTR